MNTTLLKIYGKGRRKTGTGKRGAYDFYEYNADIPNGADRQAAQVKINSNEPIESGEYQASIYWTAGEYGKPVAHLYDLKKVN